MNLRKHEAELLSKIVALLERLAMKKGQEEAMVYAVELADLTRQAVIDGKTLAQRTKGSGKEPKEKKRTDIEVEKILLALRRGRQQIQERMIDKREEL